MCQISAGEDVDNISGVKALVLKQSRSFEKMQPKRSYIDRRLPSQTQLVTPSLKPSEVKVTAQPEGQIIYIILVIEFETLFPYPSFKKNIYVDSISHHQTC